MATNTLYTRIQLKYDTYSNWSTSVFIPLKGEVCIAEIPSGSDTGLTPPAIGIKVGDGTHTFSNLPWIQGVAGDVYAWAKAANKPSYTASEIQNLDSYIATQITDTDTQYRINTGTGNDAGKYFLQSKAKNADDSTFTTISTIDLSATFSAIAALGAAANKGVDASISAGDTSVNLPTTAAVADFVESQISGITGAMHFIGTATTAITDGGTEDPTIQNYNTKTAGDVVLYNNKEYVWNGSAWEELGDENSFALKTVSVSAGGGLTGGGNLTENRTISHSIPNGAENGTKGSASASNGHQYIQTITTDDYGHVTNVTTAVESSTDTTYEIIQSQVDGHSFTFKETGAASGTTITIPDDNTTYTFAEGSTNGTISVTPSNDTAQEVTVHGLASIAFDNDPNHLTQGTGDFLLFNCGNANTLIDNSPSA